MTPIKLFSADLDGTLLGTRESTQRFTEAWNKLPPGERPLLCYNSGRLVPDILKVAGNEPLPQPDFVIGGVGTQLYDARAHQPISEFDEQFESGWNLAKVEQILGGVPGVRRQPPEFLHPRKSSWYLHHASREMVDDLRRRLAGAGLNVALIYSSGRDLDALPVSTSKGDALEWLCKRRISLKNVLVAGDTGNDSSMFLLPGVQGIVVENAQPELHEAVVHLPTYSATRAFADGVLQGLAYFRVIPEAPPSDRVVAPAVELDPALRRLFSSLIQCDRNLIAEG